jgi:hypothetical protein
MGINPFDGSAQGTVAFFWRLINPMRDAGTDKIRR